MPSWDFVFNELTWEDPSYRRTSRFIFAHQCLLQYKKNRKNLDLNEFIKFAQDLQKQRKVQADFIQPEILTELYNMDSKDLSPVAAIVGGVVAQEIIKILSGKDEPLGNCFFFNGMESRGIIENLHVNVKSVIGKDSTTTMVAIEL